MKKYSVVIPHLDGWEYLIPSLRILLESKRKDFEVIISDNLSSNRPNSDSFILSDQRVRVVHPSTRLTMQGNYEYALNNCVGEWILLIGADDAALSDVFEEMDNLIEEHPTNKIFNWSRGYYYWPGVERIYGSLSLSIVSTRQHKVLRSSNKFILALLGIYPLFDLPQMYTCTFVNRNVIEKIRSSSSRKIYPACIPDLYSSVAILLNEETYVRIESPLTLVGSSPTSLGIGNRIYLDSENNQINQETLLHSSTSDQIHKRKYNPYYLLDAYRTYCDFKGEKPKKLFIFSGYMGTLSEMIERRELMENLQEIRRHFSIFLLMISPVLVLGSVFSLVGRRMLSFQRILKRRIYLRLSPNAWKIHIENCSSLTSIDIALRTVAIKKARSSLR